MFPATSSCARSARRTHRSPLMTDLISLCRRAVVAGALSLVAAQALAQTGDYIVAIVNQELVTASEVQQRLARIRDDAARSRAALPPPAALRRQVLDGLIDERVLVTNARESGTRIDDPELDRADANRASGGEIGLRPADRLPDLFVRTTQSLKPGEVAPQIVRSGAGFHILKLVERKESASITVAQSRARHILLRPSAELTPEAA